MGNFAGKDDSGELDHTSDGAHGGVHGRAEGHSGGRSGMPVLRDGAFTGAGEAGIRGSHGDAVGGKAGIASPTTSSSSGSMMMMTVEDDDVGDDDVGDDVVTTVFRWEHGGRQVYIQGTFNNWERQLPMHRSGNDFTYICDLKRGKHAFKFIVDDEWRFAPDQLTVADVEGRINNYIDVTHFHPFNSDSSKLDLFTHKEEEVYGQVFPDVEEYSLKEPPNLPPHLRHIILNKTVPTAEGGDPWSLPPPLHVALDHLCCTAIKDGMMVLGVSQRYEHKFVTTVFYSVMP